MGEVSIMLIVFMKTYKTRVKIKLEHLLLLTITRRTKNRENAEWKSYKAAGRVCDVTSSG